MTDTMTSQNIGLSSWDPLYNLYICVEMSILTYLLESFLRS